MSRWNTTVRRTVVAALTAALVALPLVASSGHDGDGGLRADANWCC